MECLATSSDNTVQKILAASLEKAAVLHTRHGIVLMLEHSSQYVLNSNVCSVVRAVLTVEHYSHECHAANGLFDYLPRTLL